MDAYAQLYEANAEVNILHRINACSELFKARNSGNYDECDKSLLIFLQHSRECVDEFKEYTPMYAANITQCLRDIINLAFHIGSYNLTGWPADRPDYQIDDPLYALIMNIWAGLYALTDCYTGDHDELSHMLDNLTAIHEEMVLLSQACENNTWRALFKNMQHLPRSIATRKA